MDAGASSIYLFRHRTDSTTVSSDPPLGMLHIRADVQVVVGPSRDMPHARFAGQRRSACAFEPLWAFWRLQLLRDWSHDAAYPTLLP